MGFEYGRIDGGASISGEFNTGLVPTPPFSSSQSSARTSSRAYAPRSRPRTPTRAASPPRTVEAQISGGEIANLSNISFA